MDKLGEQAVARVVGAMQTNLGERITIDDMAKVAMFSKFHFTRVFQRVTGVSPARFLSALRLQEAKRFLVATDLRVTEISHRVGYNSPGTFSSRFKISVGLSPTEYRQLRGRTTRISVDNRRNIMQRRTSSVSGRIHCPAECEPGPTFVGLFRDPIPQGAPISCAVLPGPGHFQLENVPEGAWHLLVHTVPPGSEHTADRNPSVGSHGPLVVSSSTVAHVVDVVLRPMSAIDPPVLMALLDVRTTALEASRAS
ncbi:AraC family transcriptional regulator [Lentzea cavernae]|uniref:AraC family transcriptional regulator n=2 Tax=Lentzea cavernae TaxID=2020703 RepID=A0ABQ3MG74_9PSEU|nr:AraC family transcriptional regulator [Lentzea cavernae]